MSQIYKKMSEIMREIGAIGKDQTNEQQRFNFRGIDQFVNALHPALVKHGVFIAPNCVLESHELKDVVRSNGKAGVDKHVHVRMQYTFYAEDGSAVVVGPIPGEGLDSGDKATAKSLSAALKYALIQTFSIPTEDMEEGDRVSPEIQAPVRQAQSSRPQSPPAARAPAQAPTAPTPGKTKSPVRLELETAVTELRQIALSLGIYTEESFAKNCQEAFGKPRALGLDDEQLKKLIEQIRFNIDQANRKGKETA